MKHFPPPKSKPHIPIPVQAPMSDQDWDSYVRQIEREEADFFNSTAHFPEKLYE